MKRLLVECFKCLADVPADLAVEAELAGDEIYICNVCFEAMDESDIDDLDAIVLPDIPPFDGRREEA